MLQRLPRLSVSELRLPAAGVAITVIAAYVAAAKGATLGVEVLGVLLVFIIAVVGYLIAPHRAIAATVALFVAVPALKVFLTPSIGGIKDVVALGAIAASVILIAVEHRRIDRWLAILIAIFLALYIINPGHPHGSNWAQGLRLTGEPTLLLVVGLVLPNPRRNLRWGLGAFAVTGIVVAGYGLLQQAIGPSGLVALGYSYGAQVRTVGSHLRSFGTLDDPFDYSAFLYFAVAAAFFYFRRGWLLWVSETIILLGLVASLVRTAALVMIGFLGLIMIQQRRGFPALCLGVAVLVIAGLTLSKSSGLAVEPVTVYYPNGGSQQINSQVQNPGGVVLNGRVSAWEAAVGSDPVDWIFGRGVGEVGTAADRAKDSTLTTAQSSNASSTQSGAVDSGYLATVADVGIVGLLVELALFGRLIYLGARRVRAGHKDGWVPLAFMTALLLDALTRASFTGFPTAFVGFMLVGISIAAISSPSNDRELSSEGRTRSAPARGTARSVALHDPV